MIQNIWKIYICNKSCLFKKDCRGKFTPCTAHSGGRLTLREHSNSKGRLDVGCPETSHEKGKSGCRMPRNQPWKGSSGCRMPRDQPWKGQKIEKQPLGDRLGKSMARWPGKVQMRVKETPRSSGRSQPEARLTLQSTWVVSGRMTRNPALELSLIWSVCSRLVLISC